MQSRPLPRIAAYRPSQKHCARSTSSLVGKKGGKHDIRTASRIMFRGVKEKMPPQWLVAASSWGLRERTCSVELEDINSSNLAVCHATRVA